MLRHWSDRVDDMLDDLHLRCLGEGGIVTVVRLGADSHHSGRGTTSRDPRIERK